MWHASGRPLISLDFPTYNKRGTVDRVAFFDACIFCHFFLAPGLAVFGAPLTTNRSANMKGGFVNAQEKKKKFSCAFTKHAGMNGTTENKKKPRTRIGDSRTLFPPPSPLYIGFTDVSRAARYRHRHLPPGYMSAQVKQKENIQCDVYRLPLYCLLPADIGIFRRRSFGKLDPIYNIYIYIYKQIRTTAAANRWGLRNSALLHSFSFFFLDKVTESSQINKQQHADITANQQ